MKMTNDLLSAWLSFPVFHSSVSLISFLYHNHFLSSDLVQEFGPKKWIFKTKSVLPWFMHSPIKYLSNMYYMLGTILSSDFFFLSRRFAWSYYYIVSIHKAAINFLKTGWMSGGRKTQRKRTSLIRMTSYGSFHLPGGSYPLRNRAQNSAWNLVQSTTLGLIPHFK